MTNMQSTIKTLFIIKTLCLMFFISSSYAYEKDYRDYIVYYSVFNSDFLSPEMARAYKITRSHERILLNISVLKKNDDGSTSPVKAEVSGSANDLIHTRFINFKTIEEKNAVYQIGEYKTHGHTRHIFDLDIKPENYHDTLKLRFNHEVYAKKN